MFRDRKDAGRRLAARLERFAGRDDVVVLGLPRGGVPVAAEVARALGAPLDIFVVRKLGVPGHEELAAGAIASGGVRVLNPRVVQLEQLSDADLDRVVARETEELRRREADYRGSRGPLDVRGRVAIIVDDGLATGASMTAAVAALRNLRPASVVVAVPVGSPRACEDLRLGADEVECLEAPPSFMAVGQWYEDFDQTTDEEVRELLGARAASRER